MIRRARAYQFACHLFLSIFIAELGDKAQLATMLFSADRETGFILIGAWTLVQGIRTPA